MPETCDSWAAAHVNTRAWDADRPWVAENAAWLRAAFPEAWTTGAGFVRAAFTHDYYDRIIAALEHVRTVVDRMAGHLNLAPIWIVPPAWRYPMEPGFVTYGPWTSSSARVDAADLQDGQTDSLRRRIAASIAAGRGTRDSAGTFYTRGGTAFLDPLSGYAPPVLGRLGNRPLVSGWSGTPEARSTWPIGHGVQLEVAQRAALRVIWEYMDRPDAPYVWWNAPSATAWPTAPVSSARWTLGTPTGVLTAAQTGRVTVERAGSIDDGWGHGTGARAMPTPNMRPFVLTGDFPQPTPYLGPYANIRYAYATLMKIKAMSGHYAITRAIAEFAEWTRGIGLLGAEYLKEQKALSPGTDITAEMDETTALIEMAARVGHGAIYASATAAATAINPIFGAAVGLFAIVFTLWNPGPGTLSMSGDRGTVPAWPNRASWWEIPVGDGKISGLALPPMWATMPPAGLDCNASAAGARGGSSGGGDKGASKGSGAAVWIGGALAAGLVAAIAVAVAKAR